MNQTIVMLKSLQKLVSQNKVRRFKLRKIIKRILLWPNIRSKRKQINDTPKEKYRTEIAITSVRIFE